MQKELQEARCEASRMSTRCASLESDIRQLMGQEETSRRLQSENERMRRHLCSLQHEVTKLKDEKCDVYMRYTAAIEEKTAVGMRLHDLNLQVSAPDWSLRWEMRRMSLSHLKTHNCDLWGKSSKGHGERSEMWASYLDVDWKDCPMYGWGGPLDTASVKICIMSVVAFSDVIRVTSARACSPYIVFQFSWGTQSLKDVYPSRRGW